MDLNGNVTLLVNTATGNSAATYDYGPFGEPLRQSGEYAVINPFRFSTKYTDDETGLVDYGLRPYIPSTGRWLNRDPIFEKGGMNLYGFVVNDGLNHWEVLGCFASEQEAIDSAKDKIGNAARNSRLNGVKQLQQATKYLSEDAKRDILTSDAALFAIGKLTFHGVAGVEYHSSVYCKLTSDSSDSFGITGPSKGSIPSRTEFLDQGILGMVAPDAVPTGTVKTADLHTHTMAVENYFSSSGLVSFGGNSSGDSGDGSLNPDNGPPSQPDSQFGLNGRGRPIYRKFIVHENPVAVSFSLYEY